MNRTPSSSRTNSIRCSTPWKVRSVWRITGAGTPQTEAIAVAARAFFRLCSPGMAISSTSQTGLKASASPNTTLPSLTNAPYGTGLRDENHTTRPRTREAMSFVMGSS